MREHGVDPGPYLTDVHDIDFTVLPVDPELATAIANLPGRRIVYTNGGADYAAKVLEARGLTGLFDAIYGIEHAGFLPKPERGAFDAVFGLDGLDPEPRPRCSRMTRATCASPMTSGLKTVHVAPKPAAARHIHHHTDDLTAFLLALT